MDWKKTLATVAPGLATLIGGPMGAVAVTIAAKALGWETGSEKELEAAVLSGNPDVLFKLREAEANLKLEMERLGVKMEEIAAGDRDSARKLGIAQGTQVQATLSIGYNLAFIVLTWAVFGGIEVPETMREPAMYLLGILSGVLVQVNTYWFGSTSGSKAKTEAIVQLKESPVR